MFRQLRWGYYTLKSKVRWKYIKAIREENYHKKKRRFAGGNVYTNEYTSEYLYQSIMDGKPFMAGRFGLSEMYEMRSFECGLQRKQMESLEQLHRWSGFFPKELKYGYLFLEIMKNACEQVDFLAVGYQPMESYFIKKYMKKDVVMAEFRCFEPWYGGMPWSRALKGKKVLVIHPFSETIDSQMKKREKLFPGTDILAECIVITQKAVQTVAGQKDERFETWFDALQYMYDEAMKVDFDVALIGCGAYGFPLAAKLKKAGKQAIHMGGMLQVLFGIKGKRWDDDPLVSQYYNDAWVRPSDNEKPRESNIVENGCYW